MLFALDAICLAADAFVPNGKFKPGESGGKRSTARPSRRCSSFRRGRRPGRADDR